VVAALWLIARGWRVIGFRVPSAQGEIDLLARRGRVLAVIEVKRRRSLDEALAAVAPQQRARLRAAASGLIARRADLAGLAVRLDLIALGPGGWPRHIADAWPDDGGANGGWA
jgi:putative endonuclease